MPQFDVLRVKGGALVLDCQNDLLGDLPSRFVAPLRDSGLVKPTRLTPLLRVDGADLVMVTPLVRGIARRDVIGVVANLADQEWVIKSALDMLISGF